MAAFYGSLKSKNLMFVAAVAQEKPTANAQAYSLGFLVDAGVPLGFDINGGIRVGPNPKVKGLIGCDRGSFEGASGVYCAWADEHSFAFVYRYGTASNASTDEVLATIKLLVRPSAG
ncbi:hypothetical protein GCM10009662_40520 [Catellatospora coxensis]|uniref:Uncharacterized protein n=1 Tax=Catellatospora coxensis TaxID=310354 RepID=A0A8J3KV29_9ACTN|nr:hypothetical protein Cco03nite_58580 [Catellatospora coxensis]